MADPVGYFVRRFAALVALEVVYRSRWNLLVLVLFVSPRALSSPFLAFLVKLSPVFVALVELVPGELLELVDLGLVVVELVVVVAPLVGLIPRLLGSPMLCQI